MAYKLIALDMDGTLLNRDKGISEENTRAIHAAAAAGIKVIMATGRPIHDVKPYAAKLKLHWPLVVNNGSEVWRTPEILHARHVLKPEWIERIFQVIGKYGGEINYWAHTVEGRIDRSNTPKDLTEVHWLQFAVQTENAILLKDIYDELRSWNQFEISNSHITNIECNPLGISKASGLRDVCDLLGLNLSEAIAVGDSLNDIPMIRAAGLGVAMGNAQEPVKQAADAVAPTNSEDGVAAVFWKYILQERLSM